MAFPTSGTPVDSGGLSGASQSIPLPTHTTGDRLLVSYCIDAASGSPYVSHTAGWTIVLNRTDSQAAVALMVFEKIAASESETLSVTLTVTKVARAFSRVISGSDTSAPAEVSSAASDGVPSLAPDSPSLTPSWGAADTLWVSACCMDNSSNSVFSAYPASYTASQDNGAVGTSSSPTLATASRQLNADSEDPGAFTFTGGNEQWVAATIAIKPVGGGGDVADPVTAAGVATVSAAGASRAESAPAAAAGAATVSAVGGTLVLLVSSALKNNTGTLLASISTWTAWVHNPTTGALVVKLTSQASSAGGVLTLQDAAIVTATSYRVVYRNEATGAEGMETLTAT